MSEFIEEELRDSFCAYRERLQQGIVACKEVPVFTRSVDLVEYNIITQKITAIEFKINDWKRALNQLKNVEICFDYLVLCIPKPKTPKCTINIIDVCNSLGIGLYFWDKESNSFFHECIEKKSSEIWNIQKKHIIDYVAKVEV